MVSRRTFLGSLAGSAAGMAVGGGHWSEIGLAQNAGGTTVRPPDPGEDLFAWLQRVHGAFDATKYHQILGAANAFKEGDAIIGVAAADEATRRNARTLLANTRLRNIDAHPLMTDDLSRLLRQSLDAEATGQSSDWTLGELKQYLLTRDETAIKTMMTGLSSAVIGCVVKLMSNQELIAVGGKVFNPLPGSQIGAKGYLGARIQPNSPTDNVDDIRWQVLDGWAYAVGDVLLGTNPVSSDPNSVAAIEATLQDLLETFEISDIMPHCVLSHIDVQAEVETMLPGSTALWFQSIAGSDSANATFDISIEKMQEYAAARTGPFGLYFETGQGADFTNGHGHGFDMVLHEARKYGFARALTQTVAGATNGTAPWVHLNDVAGFIGPEVFRTREQLVRCCLEDIVMGKLHGLCLGLDVCSTLHMDISLDDLDWCLDEVMPANPAYLMALPTKIDPMLGYLTTVFQDHVRLREQFGYKANDAAWRFFQELGVIDQQGRPTENFGDPLWVYLQYRRKKNDPRRDDEILAEAGEQLAGVRSRGVFVAQGHGAETWELDSAIEADIHRIYADAKESIWMELEPEFIAEIPAAMTLATRSVDRTDYILHPDSGERLTEPSIKSLGELRKRRNGRHNVQIVISDGLNALSIMDEGHLAPFLRQLRYRLDNDGYRTAPENIVLNSGRVRAGYRIGETLFADQAGACAMLHVIGERPGTGHHTFSVYITAPEGAVWGTPGTVDHNLTKVVSGVATTALAPRDGADETVRLLDSLTGPAR